MKALFWVFFVGVLSFAAAYVSPILARVMAILSPFIIGLILAYVFHPIVRFVQYRLRLGRVTGVIAVAAGVVLLLAGFIAIVIPILYQQITGLVDDVSRYISDGSLDRLLLERVFHDAQREEQFRQSLADWVTGIRESVTSAISPSVLKPVAAKSVGAVRGTLGVIGSVFGWLGGTAATVVLSVVVAFYSLVGMDSIPSIIRRIIPGGDRERVWSVALRANEAVGGFLRGQLMACTGVGILTTIMLFIVGLKEYAILIGMTAGAVNFIPYLGPATGSIPAILWAIFTQDPPGWAAGLAVPGWGMRLILIGVIVLGFCLVQAVDGLVFQPFIVGKNAELHPLAVMLALIIGAQMGIAGMIVAVPLACVAKVVFLEYYWSGRTDFLESHEAATKKKKKSSKTAKAANSVTHGVPPGKESI